MKKSIKDTNSIFESEITQIVQNGLSRDIAVPTTYTKTGGLVGPDGMPLFSTEPKSYSNYLFGRRADSLETAGDCSIVRGSTLPVEANRGYNVQNVQKDLDALSNPNVTPFVGLG